MVGVGPCGHMLIITVVGPHGQSSEVMGGHLRCASMVVLGTREHWWMVVTIPQLWRGVCGWLAAVGSEMGDGW